MTYLLFISSHRFLKLRVISLNKQKLKTKKFKLQSKHSINQNIQAFGSTRLILVQRVEKSNDGNKSRELYQPLISKDLGVLSHPLHL